MSHCFLTSPKKDVCWIYGSSLPRGRNLGLFKMLCLTTNRACDDIDFSSNFGGPKDLFPTRHKIVSAGISV